MQRKVKKAEGVAKITTLAAGLVLAVGLASGLGGCATHDDTASAGGDESFDFDATPTRGAYGNVGDPIYNDNSSRSATTYTSYRPDVMAGMSASALAFPTGDESTSALLLHTVMPQEVTRGQRFDYEYHITNITGGTLDNVVLTMQSAENLSEIQASPSPSGGGSNVSWSLGALEPGETEIVEVSARAGQLGTAGNCVTVSYANVLCSQLLVTEPSLVLEKTATPLVMRCEPVVYTYTVSNPGTGVARDVVISDTIPACLSLPSGGSQFSERVGDLAPGETRTVEVVLEPVTVGECGSAASAVTASDLSADSSQPITRIVAPDLEIVCNAGRDRQFIGRPTTFSYEVTNTGTGEARDAVVTVNYPGSASVVGGSATQVAPGQLQFRLGTLQPGATQTFDVQLQASSAGTIAVEASASAFCAEPVSTRCTTEYRGIPAILLEVVDLVDPVELGEQTTYRITVTNQGSAPDTNVVIAASLPGEQEFVSATGATSERVRGQQITFGAVPSLAPGQAVSWDLTVRAVGEGDIRFGLELTSDQFPRPITETESTNQYE